MQNAIVWFDIPVRDLERAGKFYTEVLGVNLARVDHGPKQCYFFPFEPGVVSGALVQSEDNQPSPHGTVVYLNGGSDLAVPLSKVEKAGGKVLMPKTSIGEHGFIAYLLDSEGNQVALHSSK